jgi:hypothetical protein
MCNSTPNPDRTSGPTDGGQFHDQRRSSSARTRAEADGGELSPTELARLFAQSSDDVGATAEALDRRGDALAAQTHSLAEQFGDDGEESEVDHEDVDALVTETLEAIADAERWLGELHSVLTAAEEARARLDRDE